MAISDKLNYLLDTKQLFKDRLNSLGAEITSATTFRNYLNWLDTFYGEVSDKTDLSINGVVGRTSQESTTGKNKLNSSNIVTGTRNGITTSYDSTTQEITFNGTCTADNTQIVVSTDTIQFTANTTKMIAYYVSGSISGSGLFRTFIGNGDWGGYAGVDISTLDSSNPIAQVTTGASHTKARTDFRFDAGTVLTNFKIKLMITDSSDTEWEKFTYGESPNPDYPQPINNLTGDVPYKITTQNGEQTFTIPLTSKNLFDNNIYREGYTIQSNGTLNQNSNYNVYKITNIKSNTSYTIAENQTYETSTSTVVRGLAYDNQDNLLGMVYETNRTSVQRYSRTFTTPLNTSYILIQLRITDEDVQLEEGSTATTYEPYYDIKLCEIEDYKDKMYSNNGKFYLYKNIGNHTFKGDDDDSYSLNSDNTNTLGVNINPNKITQPAIKTTPAHLFANRFIYINDIVDEEHIYLTNATAIDVGYRSAIRLYIAKSRLEGYSSSLTNDQKITLVKNWLSSNNLEVCYISYTPTTTEITQENYPSLYNTLKQIQDYLTSYKINKEFILEYDSPEIEY